MRWQHVNTDKAFSGAALNHIFENISFNSFHLKKPGHRVLRNKTACFNILKLLNLTATVTVSILFFQGELKVKEKHLVKRSRWWCVGSRSTNREGETKCKRNSKCIYIWVEKWGFTATVACQAPICFNPVSRTAPLRCSLQRNVQTEGIRWSATHMKVSNCKPFIAFFFFLSFASENISEATLAFSAIWKAPCQKVNCPLCCHFSPVIFKTCEGASILCRGCGGHRRHRIE